MVTFLLNTDTHSNTNKHTHAHRAGVRDRRRGEEHRMDGVSPWKWTVSYHGDCAGHVISGTMVTNGNLKGAKQGKQQTGGGLISKLNKEECFSAFALSSSAFSFSLFCS